MSDCPKCGRPGQRWGPPYKERKGARLYPYYVWKHPDGSRCREKAGPSEGAYDYEEVTVVIPRDLLEELSHAFAYVKENNLSYQRIGRPLGRLLRKAGARLRTDEEVP